MTFVAIFLLNAGLSFALSLVVAYLVGPEAFGRYAVALSVSVVINTALFEWLRLSTTRFYSERVRTEEPDVGATLDAAYAGTAGLLVAIAACVLAAGPDLGLSVPLSAAAVAVGLAVGIFDYRTAQARARFLDRRYAALLFARGLGAFVLATAAALVWGEPTLILLGSAAAAIVALAAIRDRTGPTDSRGRARSELVLRFARYAVPLVAASALYQALPLLNRAALASRSGFAEAGYFSLASEIAVRLFQNLGSALDLALFQLAVRAEETDGREAANSQIRRNIAVVVAVLAPSAIGLWSVWPSFEALFVPPAFRGQVAGPMALAIPAFVAYALVQYALNPVFQVRKRTAPVIAAALAALALNATLLFGWPVPSDAAGVAAVQFASFALALAVLAGLTTLSGAKLPWRDLSAAVGSAALMGIALWPLRSAGAPLPTLLLQVGAGAALYGVLALAFDLCGARSLAGTAYRKLSRRPGPEVRHP